MIEIDSDEQEILVHIHFDPFMRNIQLNVHSSTPMKPIDFIAELEEVIARYKENPEELFDEANMIEPQ